MKFFALLCAGVSVQATAKRFLEELFESSNRAGHLDFASAADFINDSMMAIGLPSAITEEQVRVNYESENHANHEYDWPGDWRGYTFRYNSALFTPYEMFLVSLCEITDQLTRQHIDAVRAQEVGLDADWPVERFIELLATWYAAAQHLLQLRSSRTQMNSRYEEPLARISLHLLLGVHMLRNRYGTLFPLLHNICNCFYRSAVPGVFYINAHGCIILGLLELLERSFHLFQHNTVNFYYEAFSVQNKPNTYTLVYNQLTNMLVYYGSNEQRRRMPNELIIFTNFLVGSTMLNVYERHLRLKMNKTMALKLLIFLEKLQSIAVSVDCFTQEFMEAILDLVMASRIPSVRSKAAAVFTNMMQRRLSDELIFKCLMDYYLGTQKTPKYLVNYMVAFWQNFAYMRCLDPYLKLLTSARNQAVVRYFAAQLLSAVLEHMQRDFEANQRRIARLLETLPQLLLQSWCCATTRSILLNMYAMVDFELLKQYVANAPAIMQKFELVVSDMFTARTTVNTMQLPVLLDCFKSYLRSIHHTLNWQSVVELMNGVSDQYSRLETALQHLELQGQQPSSKLLNEYAAVLLKLRVLFETGCAQGDALQTMYTALKARLLQHQNITKYAKRINHLLDAHAIEILSACIIQSVDLATEAHNRARLFSSCKEAQELLKFLFNYLSHIAETNLIAVPTLRLTTILNCIMRLYWTFACPNSRCVLQLTARPYTILVNVLHAMLFTTSPDDVESNDSDSIQFVEREKAQKAVLLHFVHLHELPSLLIPGMIVWKLCIHYGQQRHIFNPELRMLLRALSVHHSRIYAHILPVIVFNLYTRPFALTNSRILLAIRAQQRLLDAADMCIESPALLRRHVVLAVLQLIEKSLTINGPHLEESRLLALKHLNTFVETLYLTSGNALSDIARQACALEKYALTPTEAAQLDAFLHHFCTTISASNKTRTTADTKQQQHTHHHRSG